MNPRQYGPQVLPPAPESTRILKEHLDGTPAQRRREETDRAEDGGESDRRKVRPH